MDVIVKWRDGTKNCVSVKNLKCMRQGGKMCVGAPVKMFFKKKWYYGVITMTEKDSQTMSQKSTENDSDSSSDEPLCNIAKKKYECQTKPSNDEDPFHNSDNSSDPDYIPETKKSRKTSIFSRKDIKKLSICSSNLHDDLTEKISCVSVNPVKDLNEKLNEHQNSSTEMPTIELNNPPNIKRTSMSSEIAVSSDDIRTNDEPEIMPDGHTSPQPLINNSRSDSIKSDETVCSESLLTKIDDELNDCLNVKRASISSDVTVCADDIVTNVIDDPVAMHVLPNNCRSDSSNKNDTVCSERLLTEFVDGASMPIEMPTTQNSPTREIITNRPLLSTRTIEEYYVAQCCGVFGCNTEIFSACVRCLVLLCWHHFDNDSPCDSHQELPPDLPLHNVDSSISNQLQIPEDFIVEGGPSEVNRKEKRFDKKQHAKKNKDLGNEYTTQVTKKVIPKKKLGPLCNTQNCKRMNRYCLSFSEDCRQKIFDSYWATGNLSEQRNFIARHVEIVNTKQKTVGDDSRRQNTVYYYLNNEQEKKKVCKTFFLNTLGIGQAIIKTTLNKISSSGVMEKDLRGGRKPANVVNDNVVRALVEEHINRFPKVESHYCRANTTREYLHSELTIKKMHSMLVEELQEDPKPSLSLYRKVLRSKNLSFHKPKKDQCSICSTYREGNEEIKRNLQEKYKVHIHQKNLFSEKRSERKEEAKNNESEIVCATFDMQQVISLPISNESAVFYKRRLSVYNFTIYEMVSHDCYCYTWHEAQSKRGASEISTGLYLFLKSFDEKGMKKVYLFADGCSGQNKNSIVASTLLYMVNNSISIEEIILSISVPCHGQNEGDSAHSAIDYAVKKSGDIYIPAQLIPIIRLARRKQPYKVNALNFSDFLDFKRLSQNLRILSVRKDNEGEIIDWRNMVELSFSKTDGDKIFFKTDRSAQSYRYLTLRRQVSEALASEILPLNSTPHKLSQEKYNDLMALTEGDTPVIRSPEFVEFYQSLPH